MRHAFRRSSLICLAAGLGLLAGPARATWSIVIVDTRTKEVAIGSATCLLRFDLQHHLPVVRQRVGAAAAQSYVDFTATNRRLIWEELGNGTDPATILDLLEAQDNGHQTRQYGIVDVLGRSATFSGTQCGAYANGLTGQIGTLVYSIQGNVITGQPVLDEAESALRNTPGGIPEKLMAAMEAARAMGGDGRCSCSGGDPTGCGSPPDDFNKSAHIGFMIVTRRGDVDGGCARETGCANGLYYLDFNILANNSGDPDPVLQMRDQFDAWRAGLSGKPDAVTSSFALSAEHLEKDGLESATLTIEIRDWQGQSPADLQNVAVVHDWEGSAGSSSVGPLQDLGNGRYAADITSGATAGLDRFVVIAQHSTGLVYLMPDAEILVHHRRGDLNGDNAVDGADIDAFLLALTDPDTFAQQYPHVARDLVGDINEDGAFDGADIDAFFALLGG